MKSLIVIVLCLPALAFTYPGEVKEIGKANLISFRGVQNPTCSVVDHGYQFRNRAWFYVEYSDGAAKRWLGIPVDSDSWNTCADAKRQTAMSLAYKNSNFHAIQSGYLATTAYGCEEKYIVATLADPITLPSGEKGESANFVYGSKAVPCP